MRVTALLIGAALSALGGLGGLWGAGPDLPRSDGAVLRTVVLPVRPGAAGRVQALAVAENELVRAGEPLLRLAPTAAPAPEEVDAPCAGWVRGLSVRPGQLVGRGQTLLSLARDDAWWVEAEFPAADRALLTPGRPVHVRLAGDPDAALAGALQADEGTGPAPDGAGGEIRMRVRLDERPADPRLPLREGTAATVTLDPAP